MKHKYITKQMLLAFRVNPQTAKKDIHAMLAETIAERKLILKQWELSFFGVASKDIHALLAETIAERLQILAQWERVFLPEQDTNYLMEDKQAA